MIGLMAIVLVFYISYVVLVSTLGSVEQCTTNLQLKTIVMYYLTVFVGIVMVQLYCLLGSHLAEPKVSAWALISSDARGPPPGSLVVGRILFLVVIYDCGPHFLAGCQLGVTLSSYRSSQILTRWPSHNIVTYSKPVENSSISYIRQPNHRSDYPIFTGTAHTKEEGIIQDVYTRGGNHGAILPITVTSIKSSYPCHLCMLVDFIYLKQGLTSYFKYSYRYQVPIRCQVVFQALR